MVTMQTADNALKSYYLDAVSEALDMKTNPLFAQIKKSTADVLGKDVRKLVRYGVNGGIGAGTETGSLPTAGGNNYVQFVSTLKNLYGTIEISDKAIRASASNEGAFVNLLNDEMSALVRSSSFNFGRMLYGDGSGKLCSVASVGSNNAITMDNDFFVHRGGGQLYYPPAFQGLRNHRAGRAVLRFGDPVRRGPGRTSLDEALFAGRRGKYRRFGDSARHR